MTPTHRSDDMTDNLREAAQAVLDRWDSVDWKAPPTAEYMNRLRAALAAAPQPEGGQPTIRCNKCGGTWTEDDLIATLDAEDGEPSRPCPTCGTDHYLMDIAAAPQPAPVDREALVEVIEMARERSTSSYAIADALLARGLRLPSETRNRAEYDDAGKLDEVVTDAGMHFESMSDNDWFLSGQRSDGSEIAIWIRGKVTLVEERPAIRVGEGSDNDA